MYSEKEYEKARQQVLQAEKQQLIDDFEKAGREKRITALKNMKIVGIFSMGFPYLKKESWRVLR